MSTHEPGYYKVLLENIDSGVINEAPPVNEQIHGEVGTTVNGQDVLISFTGSYYPGSQDTRDHPGDDEVFEVDVVDVKSDPDGAPVSDDIRNSAEEWFHSETGQEQAKMSILDNMDAHTPDVPDVENSPLPMFETKDSMRGFIDIIASANTQNLSE